MADKKKPEKIGTDGSKNTNDNKKMDKQSKNQDTPERKSKWT